MINPQSITQLMKDLQKGVAVPRKSIQLAKGFLQAMEEKHNRNKEPEKAKAVKDAINYLNKQ